MIIRLLANFLPGKLSNDKFQNSKIPFFLLLILKYCHLDKSPKIQSLLSRAIHIVWGICFVERKWSLHNKKSIKLRETSRISCIMWCFTCRLEIIIGFILWQGLRWCEEKWLRELCWLLTRRRWSRKVMFMRRTQDWYCMENGNKGI